MKKLLGVLMGSLLGAALPAQAQVYRSWAAATGFTGIPVTDSRAGLGAVASARTTETSPMGGTGSAYGMAWAEVGTLHVLAEARTDSLSKAVGEDQNFAFSGRDNTAAFNLASPSFYATAAQFTVDDIILAGAGGAALVRTNMSLHAILDSTAATALGNFTAESGFYLSFAASQRGVSLGSGTLKVSRSSAGVTTNTASGLLLPLGAVTPEIRTGLATDWYMVDLGVPLKVEWFLSAYGIAFTNGGNSTQGKSDMSSTFSWATSGSVFEITGGGTANSVQGGISNNLFSTVASAPEPTSLLFLALGATLVIVHRRNPKG